MRVLKVARAHVGATVLGVALLGGGVATAAVVVTPASSSDEVYEVPEATEPAATTTASEAAELDAVAEPPVSAPVEAPPATVEDVTEPAPVATEPAPETIPAPQVNPDGSLPEGWTAPQNPGEPPRAPETKPEREAPLPGEPGYVQPGG